MEAQGWKPNKSQTEMTQHFLTFKDTKEVTKMVEMYCKLSIKMDEMIKKDKMHSDNPIVRSMGRKLWKMYKAATKEEKLQIEAFENIYFNNL